MGEPNSYAFLVFFVIVVLLLNFVMSRDVINWVDSRRTRAGLLVLIWTLPGIGFVLANRLGHLGWFKRERW